MGRRTVRVLLGGAALAAVLAVGLVQAQDNDPPPLIFDDPPQNVRPPVEEPPPPPGEVTPPVDPAPLPPDAAGPADTAAADETDAEEEEEERAETPPLVEEPPTPPGKRTRHGVVILQALDKITAETIRFEARVGAPVKWRGLVFTLRSCETTASDEVMTDSIAYLQIRSEPRTLGEQQPSREVFRGWMFASSPGLAPLEHPIYDAWVIACKASPPATRG